MSWGVFKRGDPDEHIYARRFGKCHDKPCERPNVTTCAMPECQYADKCQANAPKPPSTPRGG